MSFRAAISCAAALLMAIGAAACGGDAPTELPPAGAVRGIDVSRWQEDINWRKVKQSGVRFAFMKATEGYNLKDRYFQRNWRDARRVGITRGAYHFFNPKNGVRQARNFISTVRLREGDLPPVLDFEIDVVPRPDPRIQKYLDDWMKLVRAHYGVRPIVYTSYWHYKYFFAEKYSDHVIWLMVGGWPKPGPPRISRKRGYPAALCRGKQWAFLQYSVRGRIPGIVGPVDLNYFRGTEAQLQSLLMPANRPAREEQSTACRFARALGMK